MRALSRCDAAAGQFGKVAGNAPKGANKMSMEQAMRAILAAPQSPAAIRAGLDALHAACGYTAVAHIFDNGEWMDINAAGWISRKGRNAVQASAAWRITGAVERTNFGTVARCYSLAELLENPRDIPWAFKNGKPRVFIRDQDHGTMREWGRAAFITLARTDAAHVATLQGPQA